MTHRVQPSNSSSGVVVARNASWGIASPRDGCDDVVLVAVDPSIVGQPSLDGSPAFNRDEPGHRCKHVEWTRCSLRGTRPPQAPVKRWARCCLGCGCPQFARKRSFLGSRAFNRDGSGRSSQIVVWTGRFVSQNGLLQARFAAAPHDFSLPQPRAVCFKEKRSSSWYRSYFQSNEARERAVNCGLGAFDVTSRAIIAPRHSGPSEIQAPMPLATL